MTTHYAIVGWDQHYEVDDQNRAWKPGKTFRSGPLEYIRIPARRDWNIKTLELQDQMGDQVWLYIGAFEKLCSIVACEPRCRREGGIIRNSDGQPATLEEIARMLRIKSETAESIVATLARPEIRWVQPVEGPREAPSEPQESAGSSEPLQVPADFCGSPPKPAGICYKSSQVKSESEQDKSSQVEDNVKVEPSPPDPEPDAVAPPDRAGVHDGSGGGGLDSTRQDEWLRTNLMIQLKLMLRPGPESDNRTLANFEQWLHQEIQRGRDGPVLRREVVAIARDCLHGERPMAVFLSRVKQQLGYVPPSRKLPPLMPPPAYLPELRRRPGA